MLSHLNLVAEVYITSLSGRQWAEKELAKGNQLPEVEYRTLAHLPISHIAGLLGYNLGPIYSAGTVVWYVVCCHQRNPHKSLFGDEMLIHYFSGCGNINGMIL